MKRCDLGSVAQPMPDPTATGTPTVEPTATVTPCPLKHPKPGTSYLA